MSDFVVGQKVIVKPHLPSKPSKVRATVLAVEGEWYWVTFDEPVTFAASVSVVDNRPNDQRHYEAGRGYYAKRGQLEATAR